MRRLLAVAVVAALGGAFAPAARAEDTPLAAFTRAKKLKGKVTVNFKNEFLKEAFNELSAQLEEQKRGELKIEYEKGVSGNTRINYAGKDVTVEEALDGILKQLDLGYVVISNPTSRGDGYLRIVKGPNRGYETGQEPKGTATAKVDPKKPAATPVPEVKKPDPEEMKKPDEAKKPEEPKPAAPAPAANTEDEALAAGKLALAKQLIEKGKPDSAKIQLKFILKKYPTTAAAAEAKALMENADK